MDEVNPKGLGEPWKTEMKRDDKIDPTKNWVISDMHFGHANIIKYCNRPYADVTEMDEKLIANWNSVVQPGQKVWHGGDFGDLKHANRLNGQKRAIIGNHDYEVEHMVGKFKKIAAWKRWRIDGICFVLTHFPIVLSTELGAIHFNLHGHTHTNFVLLPNGQKNIRYLNMCVEHWNYTPVRLDEIVKELKQRMKFLQG